MVTTSGDRCLDELLDEWSRRHDGYDLSGSALARRWVLLMHGLARPLASREVSPDVVTAVGTGLGVAAARVPPPLAATLLVLAAVADGLDGAIAVQRRTTTRHGRFVDHAADRVGDVASGVALARAGAGPLGHAAAMAALGYELARDWQRMSGRAPAGAVMVGERPVRVVVAAAGLTTRRPRLAAGVVVGLCTASTVQLAVSVRRGRR